MRKLLRPLDYLYGVAVGVKNALYDSNRIPKIKTKAKVVSIGNLTMGGAGKTPFSIWLTQELILQKQNVCIVARGYGASVDEIKAVHPTDSNYKDVGDEPLLMARATGTPVYVGPIKSQTAEHVDISENCDIIIVDDGFQHRKLFRNLDIVLIDTTVDPKSLRLFPSGNLREPFSNAKRADLTVLTKCNLSNFVSEYEEKLKEHGLSFFKSGLQFESTVNKIVDGRPIFCLSGIANPLQFEKSVAKLYPNSPIIKCRFPDHHKYSNEELSEVRRDAEKNNAIVLTTEKDFLKIPDMGFLNLFVLKTKIEFEPNEGERFNYALRSSLGIH